MVYRNLIVDKRDGIGLIKINRPEVRNALGGATLAELETAFTRFQTDDQVAVIVFTGAGEHSFAAGTDLAPVWCKTGSSKTTSVMDPLCKQLDACEKVTVAAVNGSALGGGCELALSCDIRIAAEHARFELPELPVACAPTTHALQRLIHLVGRGRALDLLLTGDAIPAQHAYEMGLVSGIAPMGQLMRYVYEKASKIVAKGPAAARLAKYAVQQRDAAPVVLEQLAPTWPLRTSMREHALALPEQRTVFPKDR